MPLSPVRRRWLLVEMAVFALPTTIALLGLIGMLLVFLFSSWPGADLGAAYSGGRSPVAAPLVVLVAIALACLAGFWRIAGAALLGRSMRDIGMSWWLMMKVGMLLAIVFGAIVLVDSRGMTSQKLLDVLLMGPALLVPATHLLIERRKR